MNPYLPPSAASASTSPPAYEGSSGASGRAEVTDATIEAMRQTKPWVVVMGVITLIGAVFMCLGGGILMVAGALMPRGAGGPIPSAVLGLVYIPFAVLYVYPGLKLWSYGKSIGQLMSSRSSADLETALGHQKSFWKFVGILTLCVVGLYILVFLGAMVTGVMAAGRAAP